MLLQNIAYREEEGGGIKLRDTGLHKHQVLKEEKKGFCCLQ